VEFISTVLTAIIVKLGANPGLGAFEESRRAIYLLLQDLDTISPATQARIDTAKAIKSHKEKLNIIVGRIENARNPEMFGLGKVTDSIQIMADTLCTMEDNMQQLLVRAELQGGDKHR